MLQFQWPPPDVAPGPRVKFEQVSSYHNQLSLAVGSRSDVQRGGVPFVTFPWGTLPCDVPHDVSDITHSLLKRHTPMKFILSRKRISELQQLDLH